MTRVRSSTLPPDALLQRYVGGADYVDCFSARVPVTPSLATLVTAFYTSWLFDLERGVLRVAANIRSSDAGVGRLARDETREFAAWRVEARAPHQLLLADVRGRTRSWLMVERPGEAGPIYFGSAVLRAIDPDRGKPRVTLRPLLFAHRLYSRALLACAVAQLERG